MMALLKLFFRPRQSGDTEKIKTLERYQQDACEERRRQEAFMRELAVYDHNRVSLRKPGKVEG